MSVTPLDISLSLIGGSIVQVEATFSDNQFEYSLHRLDTLFGQSETSFASGNADFLRYPEYVQLNGTTFFARYSRSDGSNAFYGFPIEVERYPNVQLRVRGPDDVSTLLAKIPISNLQEVDEECWSLTCVDSYAFLFRLTPAQPHVKISQVNLNKCIGNQLGTFTLMSGGFLQSSRNVRLTGTKLCADLDVGNGAWKTRSLDVKGLVRSRLMLGDVRFSAFDDGNLIPWDDLPLPLTTETAQDQSPYAELNREKKVIRLCRIMPGEWNDPIECSLLQRDAESEQPYNCLSYVWGDRTDTRQIYIDGCPLSVTSALCCALQQLRLRADHVPIWIDAICINQQDAAEKSWQVAMMGDIYRKAESVIVWFGTMASFELGEGPSNISAVVLPALENVFRHMAQDGHFFTIPGLFEVSEHGAVRNGSQYRAILQALELLIKLPWWSRAWTLQEIIIPDTVICLFGPLEVTWYGIFLASFVLMTHNETCKPCVHAFDLLQTDVRSVLYAWTANFIVLEKCRQTYRDNIRSGTLSALREEAPRDIPLAVRQSWNAALMLLGQSKLRQCSVVHDKVFSLLAMTPLIDGLVFTPDYKSDVQHVYRDFTLHIMTASRSLHIWDIAFNEAREDRDDSSSNSRLPTWVVDWRSRSLMSGQASIQIMRSLGFGFQLSPPIQTPPRVIDDALLVVEGSEVDTVSLISESVWPAKNFDTHDAFKHVLREWHSLVSESCPQDYILGGTMYDAFWRTMLNDHIVPKVEHPDHASVQSGLRRCLPQDIEAWTSWSKAILGSQLDISSHLPESDSANERELDATIQGAIPTTLLSVATGRKLFVTIGGLIGLGPYTAVPGDVCFALKSGTQWHYLLRPAPSHPYHRSDRRVYTLVGPVYVHGIMDGKGNDLLEMAETIYVA